jgi:GalNAc-alpha-(1->4)-GalNAc-alpha-(1->3)-diNAcBac-PP-undecaprenol alpha-1,4-N-acetyl-D-galactosaminyltransferase
VIPNPVEVPSFVSPVLERKKLIVNVGSIGRLKNQEFLIRAFARVKTGEDWELALVGDGPDRPRLEALVQGMALASRVTFLGERKDVSRILSNAQVFAFTSLSEGFPNALAEALANGCACISLDCPTGPAELIQNDRTGFLVPLGDESAYVDKLERLLADNGLRARFSKQGSASVRAFSREKVLWRFERLIANERV